MPPVHTYGRAHGIRRVADRIVALVIRWLGGTAGSSGGLLGQKGASARRILEERFARGEIDEEECRQRKKAPEE